MQWFARHPKIVLLLVFAADVWAAWRVNAVSKSSDDTSLAPWMQLSVMCVLLGPPCVLFPAILGGIQGPACRGAWMNPTPAAIVTAFGWLLMATPLLVLLDTLLFRD